MAKRLILFVDHIVTKPTHGGLLITIIIYIELIKSEFEWKFMLCPSLSHLMESNL